MREFTVSWSLKVKDHVREHDKTAMKKRISRNFKANFANYRE